MVSQEEKNNQEDLSQKVDAVLASRRGPREAKEDPVNKPIKFVVEYKDEHKNLTSRWTYDLKKNPFGPILVENFGEEFLKLKKDRKSK